MATEKTEVIKVNALLFNDPECFAKAVKTEDEKIRLEMVAYSGGVIKNHWYWGNIAFDLNGIRLPKGPSPILEEHSLSRKIGVAHKYSMKNNRLEVVEAEFVSTEASQEFQKLSSEGFPFQSSIRGVPLRVERIDEGASTQVNGFTLSGPGTVWREWALKESSVCVFGADSNTSAKAFSEEESHTFFVENIKRAEGEVTMFDLEKVKLENPDVFSNLEKEIRDRAVREVEDRFAVEKADLLRQNTELQESLTKMSNENQKLAKEKEIKETAKTIFEPVFNRSNLPSRFYPKIFKLVDYNQFIRDGNFDSKAFSDAVTKELEDWKEFNTAHSALSLVQGGGTYQREAAGSAFTDEEAETEADKLFKMVK
jgi:hypothetical protein